MTRSARGGLALPAVLYLVTGLSVVMGAVRAWEVPQGALPADSLHLAATPLAIWVHALSATIFGLLGPLQFGRVLRRRFGRAHRTFGRVFAVAGVFMAASGLRLVLAHPETAAPLVDGARAAFSVGLVAAIALSVQAIRLGEREGHRDWMIRAYALGTGTAPVAIVFIPIYVATGAPPIGPLADAIFIGTWTASVAVAELVILRLRRPTGLPA